MAGESGAQESPKPAHPTGPENRHVVTMNPGRSKGRSYVRDVFCRPRSHVGRSYVIASRSGSGGSKWGKSCCDT